MPEINPNYQSPQVSIVAKGAAHGSAAAFAVSTVAMAVLLTAVPGIGIVGFSVLTVTESLSLVAVIVSRIHLHKQQKKQLRQIWLSPTLETPTTPAIETPQPTPAPIIRYAPVTPLAASSEQIPLNIETLNPLFGDIESFVSSLVSNENDRRVVRESFETLADVTDQILRSPLQTYRILVKGLILNDIDESSVLNTLQTSRSLGEFFSGLLPFCAHEETRELVTYIQQAAAQFPENLLQELKEKGAAYNQELNKSQTKIFDFISLSKKRREYREALFGVIERVYPADSIPPEYVQDFVNRSGQLLLTNFGILLSNAILESLSNRQLLESRILRAGACSLLNSPARQITVNPLINKAINSQPIEETHKRVLKETVVGKLFPVIAGPIRSIISNDRKRTALLTALDRFPDAQNLSDWTSTSTTLQDYLAFLTRQLRS